MDMKNITEKITLPVAILLSVVILAISFYAVQYNKQQSIEKQQQIKIQEDRRIEEARAEQEQSKNRARAEQEHKEYVAKRKLECYDLEQRERENYNNIDGSFYDEENDLCKVRYENKNWKEGDPLFSGLVDTDGDGIKDEYQEGKYFTKEY